MYTKGTLWTQDQIDTAITMKRAGCSASVIGIKLGVTRNAVIGKLHRMGFRDAQVVVQRRISAERPKRTVRQTPSIASSARPPDESDNPDMGEDNGEATELQHEVCHGTVTLMGLNSHTCRWPLDGGLYCGELPVESKPYCGQHCKRAYNHATDYGHRPRHSWTTQRGRRARRAALIGRSG